MLKFLDEDLARLILPGVPFTKPDLINLYRLFKSGFFYVCIVLKCNKLTFKSDLETSPNIVFMIMAVGFV